MASQDWFDKDFYAILGVPPDADAAAIKKAYRKLARKLHPDHNAGDAAAEQRFKEIGEAYAVLSDPEQRQRVRRDPRDGHGGARFTAGGPAAAAARPASRTSSRPVRRRPGRGAGGQRPLHDRRAGPASPTSRTCSADVRAGRGRPAVAAASGFRAPPGPRSGADVTARTTLPFRQAVEGATVTLGANGGGRHHPDPRRASTTARRSGCAARARPATTGRRPATCCSRCRSSRTRSSAVTATTSPSTCRSPSPRPRSAPRCRCPPSPATRSRCGSPRARRAAGCCGSRAGASPTRPARATCWPR